MLFYGNTKVWWWRCVWVELKLSGFDVLAVAVVCPPCAKELPISRVFLFFFLRLKRAGSSSKAEQNNNLRLLCCCSCSCVVYKYSIKFSWMNTPSMCCVCVWMRICGWMCGFARKIVLWLIVFDTRWKWCKRETLTRWKCDRKTKFYIWTTQKIYTYIKLT